MNGLLVTARAIHYLAAILFFGELVFLLAVARPARRKVAELNDDDAEDRRLLVIALWGIAVSIASAAAWLALEAISMSGLPVAQATRYETLSLVLTKTTFGRVWLVRLGLVIVLCALLWAFKRAPNAKHDVLWATLALVVAAAYLAMLASVGHAGAGQGIDRIIQIASDAAHLLAAGAWLGALPALARLLGGGSSPKLAAQATLRFSTLGVICVSALLFTGLINAWYLVGTWPAFVATDYGRLLLGKLVLFATMASVAAINRWYLTPRVVAHEPQSRRSLRRNAMLEISLGLGVLIIVGALGISVPAAHEAMSERMPIHAPAPTNHEH